MFYRIVLAVTLLFFVTVGFAQKSYKLSVDYKYDFSFIYSSNGYAADRKSVV